MKRKSSSKVSSSSKSPPSKKSKDSEETKESTDQSLYKKKRLSKKQVNTILTYNEKTLEQDKDSLVSIFTFLSNQLEPNISIKLGISSIYLVIEELFNLSGEGIIGIQGEKSIEKLVKSISQFENCEQAVVVARDRIEKQLFIVNNHFQESIGELEEIEESDCLHIFKRIKNGYGLIGKGVLIEKNDTTAILNEVESLLEFAKIDSKDKEFSLRLVRKNKSKREKEVHRPSFLSKKSTLITESDSESELEFESESEHEPHLESESELVELEKAKSKEKSQHELERGSELTQLLQIPNFIEHYQQVIQENLQLKKKVGEYEKANKSFNHAIKLIVECVDNHPRVFNLNETTITIGQEAFTISHRERSVLNKLNESKKIQYIADNILKKPLKDVNDDEKELIIGIVMDIRGLNVNTDKEEVKKLRNIFRNIKCNSKKQ